MSKLQDTPAQRFQSLGERLQQTEWYHDELAKAGVADKIDEVMRNQGISKAELARRLKVSPSYVTKLCTGENLTIGNMTRIARALNCEVSITLQPKTL